MLFTGWLLEQQEMPRGTNEWEPYLDILPKGFNEYPLLFKDEELKHVYGSLFYKEIKERQLETLQAYNLIVKNDPEFARFSYQVFASALLCTQSRIFQVKTTKRAEDVCMVPLSDMYNHDLVANCQWGFDIPSDCFKVKADSDIPRGRAINLSYGDKTNSVLLQYYGFVIPDNKTMEVPLQVKIFKNDKDYGLKMALLNLQGGKSNKWVSNLALNLNQSSSQQFLSFNRFITFDKDIEVLMKIKNDMMLNH